MFIRFINMKLKSRVGLVSISRVLSSITFVNSLSVKKETFFFTDHVKSDSNFIETDNSATRFHDQAFAN